jgi:hypothetical protein
MIGSDFSLIISVAESFSLRASSTPPTVFELPLGHPKGVPPSQWGSRPNYTRPLPLTASICFDFAAPGPFSNLEVRPAVVLAPAKTWHKLVGQVMWNQAKQRADELGSMVLWCDGGEGGVSGIAGQGVSEMQVGEGSWIRSVGIQYPYQGRLSVYAHVGHWWLFALCASLVFGFLPTGPHTQIFTTAAGKVKAGTGTLWRRLGDIGVFTRKAPYVETGDLLD